MHTSSTSPAMLKLAARSVLPLTSAPSAGANARVIGRDILNRDLQLSNATYKSRSRLVTRDPDL